jgi:hypothetical protein
MRGGTEPMPDGMRRALEDLVRLTVDRRYDELAASSGGRLAVDDLRRRIEEDYPVRLVLPPRKRPWPALRGPRSQRGGSTGRRTVSPCQETTSSEGVRSPAKRKRPFAVTPAAPPASTHGPVGRSRTGSSWASESRSRASTSSGSISARPAGRPSRTVTSHDAVAASQSTVAETTASPIVRPSLNYGTVPLPTTLQEDVARTAFALQVSIRSPRKSRFIASVVPEPAEMPGMSLPS